MIVCVCVCVCVCACACACVRVCVHIHSVGVGSMSQVVDMTVRWVYTCMYCCRNAVKRAGVLVNMKHGMARLDNVWGVGGGQWPVKVLTKQVLVPLTYSN